MRKLFSVATHDGRFHADDVFAVATIMLIEPGVRIIRTREASELHKASVVVDVGGVYNPDADRFDHHQCRPNNLLIRRENGHPYSSFGLVWKKYGSAAVYAASPLDKEETDKVAAYIDARLVTTIDACDCGVALVRYLDAIARPMDLSEVIDSMNPIRRESCDIDFLHAVRFASVLLRRNIDSVVATIEAELEVVNCLAESEDDDPRLVVFTNGAPIGWQRHLIPRSKRALFVVYLNETRDTWMVQCVPDADAIGSFGKRKPLPKKWGGLRDEELARETGVPDAVFCHPGLFICGARSKEGALALLKCALE